VLRRSGVEGKPISPLASFVDPEGQAYVAFRCHDSEVCIDRIVPDSGWDLRKWYLLGYILPIAVMVAGRDGVRERWRDLVAKL
jgi:hypothetical protein